MPRDQRVEIVAPRDRHGDVADRVLEDQIPADDPRDQLAERRVRVGVGASRLRDHRRELRVAQPASAHATAEQEEREDQRRSCAVADDLPLGATWPAAAVPIAPKIPAPMTAPIASMIRSPAPSTRLSDRPLFAGEQVVDRLSSEHLFIGA